VIFKRKIVIATLVVSIFQVFEISSLLLYGDEPSRIEGAIPFYKWSGKLLPFSAILFVTVLFSWL